MSAHTKTIWQQLEDKFVITDTCWVWIGSRARGYGKIGKNKTTVGAHRAIYEVLVGPIEKDLEIDHLCRNKLCVNPSHLESVTRRENQLRSNSVSGKAARQTECVNGHPFTPENTYHRPDRANNRTCKKCALERTKNFEIKRKLLCH